jgi:tetratricopeptide (TPR) repeat protein
VPDAQQPFSPRQRPDRATPATQPSTDQSRAAAHLRAAGQVEAAIEQYLAAVREVAVRGDAQRAYGLAEQALQLFDELPPSNRRALLRVQLLIEKGRLQWHGALLGASFTLQEALASLETARLSLPDDAVPEVVAQLATVTAGICYDLGDLDALQRGLEVLTESSRRLLDMGESLLATCLLNDQAAVYVRLGDPVRASHLLSKSHELFDGLLRRNPHDLMALEELAETNHLLAACLCMCTFAPDASPRRMLVVSNMRVGRNVSINASGHVSNWRVSGKRWDVWKCSVGNCRWRRSALPQHSRCNGRWVM